MDVAVFIDWQNVYRSAREAFELRQAPGARGNFDPLALAKYLARGNKRGKAGKLVTVEIHRGLPQPNDDPKGHGAAVRQAQAWRDLDGTLVNPKLRPVKLNPKTGKAEEKGIDVALACSAVEHVLMGKCEVAIIFSHDSDLLPQSRRFAGSAILRRLRPHRGRAISSSSASRLRRRSGEHLSGL